MPFIKKFIIVYNVVTNFIFCFAVYNFTSSVPLFAVLVTPPGLRVRRQITEASINNNFDISTTEKENYNLTNTDGSHSISTTESVYSDESNKLQTSTSYGVEEDDGETDYDFSSLLDHILSNDELIISFDDSKYNYNYPVADNSDSRDYEIVGNEYTETSTAQVPFTSELADDFKDDPDAGLSVSATSFKPSLLAVSSLAVVLCTHSCSLLYLG